MNILSLFDGCSGGQQALERAGIKYNKYYASEIDKYAIKVTQHNYPNTIQLGSVVDVNVSDLEPIDLLIGGSPCFGAGTKVLTIDGYKDIETLKVGDEVLTHNNRYRKVLSIGGKIAETYNLKIHGAVDTVVTANHPYYARKKESIWLNDLRTRRVILGEKEWVSADKLNGKYRVAHINCNIEENPLGITTDEAYIIGRYIADGHTRKDYRVSEKRPNHRHWQLILSIGEQKVNDFNSPLKHSLYKHGDSCYRAVFSNKRLVEIVEEHCGIGAENKFFSEMLVRLPKNILMEVFNGYISGDGCISNGIVQCSSVSRMLAITLQRVVHKLFGLSLTVFQDHCAGKRMLMGREITQKDCYVMRFNPHQENKNYTTKDGFYLWVNAKKFTHIGKDIVYNIEVEEDNSYTANGIVVHNCQSFSFAGKRNGMTTSCSEEIYTLDRYLELKQDGFQFEGESYLFWEYMRVLTDIRKYNPNVLFLLENVEMGAKWERVLSEAIGIYGVHINSALVSAQNRKRIYWTNIRVREEGLFGELHSDIPQPEDRGILLKDILEDEVDEKYYLSEKMLNYFNSNSKKMKDAGNGFSFSPTMGDKKAKAVTTRCGSRMEDEYIIGGQMGFEKDFQASDKAQTLLARDYKGMSNTGINVAVCCAMRGRGENNEQTLEPQPSGKTNTLTSVQKDNLVMQLNPSTESGGKQPYQHNRCYDVNGISPCLNTDARSPAILIPEATAKGYVEIEPGECFDAENINSKTRRGRKMVNKSNCLMAKETDFMRYEGSLTPDQLAKFNPDVDASKHNALTQAIGRGGSSSEYMDSVSKVTKLSAAKRSEYFEPNESPNQTDLVLAGNMRGGRWENIHESSRRVYAPSGKAPTVATMQGGNQHPKTVSHARIRRLTPLECERLQTVKDDFTACVSDSQRYKMLGNGFNIETVAHILKFIYKDK